MMQDSIWLIIRPQVFVDFTANKILLYDTEKTLSLISKDKLLISLVHKLYEPQNMGVLSFGQFLKFKSEDTIQALELGFFMKISVPQKKRPINFLPIPNIQYDIEKENFTGEEQIKKYRNKLNLITAIYMQLSDGNASKEMMEKRNRIALQYSTPSFYNTQQELSPTVLDCILSEASFTQLTSIDILVASEGVSEEHLKVLEQHRFNYHFHVYADGLENLLNTLHTEKNILISCYCDGSVFLQDFNIICRIKENLNIEYVGLLEDENNSSKHYTKLYPVWNGKNLSFFRNNVFLESEEILNSSYSFDELFQHQKVNSNFFGAIMILPSGRITPYLSDVTIGYCKKENNDIQKAVTKELIENNRWRLTRNRTECRNCIMRYLCPPVTSFECNFDLSRICNFG